MRTTSALAIAVAALAMPASGQQKPGWQWTNWGMTPEQVITAAAGKAAYVGPERVRPVSTFMGSDCTVELAQPHAGGDIIFDRVYFCFTDGKLSRVTLHTSERASIVQQQVAAALGQPVNQSHGFTTYTDRERGNSVTVLTVASALVTYTPIPQGI